DQTTSGLTINGAVTTDAVTNQGTYIKTGSGTTAVNVAFNNSGTADVQNGIFDLNGAVANTGTLQVEAGTLNVLGAVSGTGGSVAIGGGGLAEFQNTFSQNVNFSGSGTLQLAHSQGYAATISGFGPGTKIDLTDFAASIPEADVWNSSSGKLT